MGKLWLSALAFFYSFLVTPKRIDRMLLLKGERTEQNLDFTAPEAVKVAAVQLSVRKYERLGDYLSEMHRLAAEAAEDGAQVVVYPEYVGLLAATILPGYERMLAWVIEGDKRVGLAGVRLSSARVKILAEAFHNLLYEIYMHTFSTIARLQKIYIVAGTNLFYEDGKLHNRSLVFGPDGRTVGAQEKISPIGLDKALGVVPCSFLETIETEIGPLAVVIGSDNYYFECAKIARAHGVCLIAAPDSREGVMRDLLRCRAQEQHCYIAYACLTGNRPETTALAALLAPASLTPERDGVVASAETTSPQPVIARLNFEKLAHLLPESAPNPDFLRGDYLHSYRYCGTPPLGTQSEPSTLPEQLEEQQEQDESDPIEPTA